MSLLRVDRITNRLANSGPIIVGLTTIAGNLICSGITSITDGLVVSAATTTSTLNVTGTSNFGNNLTVSSGNIVVSTGNLTVSAGSYFGDGVTLSGIVTEIRAGNNIAIDPGGGKGTVRIDVSGSVDNADYAKKAGLSTNLEGGQSGTIAYQSGANATAFTAVGSAGEILQSNGGGAPTWTSISLVAVGYAETAGVATDVQGGSAGDVLYQNATDDTAFVGGNFGDVLTSRSNLSPQFTAQSNLVVGSAGVATDVRGGIASVSALNVYDSGISTLSGPVSIGGSLDVSGTSELSNVRVDGFTTFAGVTTSTSNVFVQRGTFLNNLQVIGLTTFTDTSQLDIDASLVDIDGQLNVDNVNVDGVSTFSAKANFGEIDVDLQADFDNISVSGVSTFTGLGTFTNGLNVTGVTSVRGTLEAHGQTNLDNVVVSGVSTFIGVTSVGFITANSLFVSGVSTFTGVTTFSDIGVSRLASIHHLLVHEDTRILGVTTIEKDLDVNGSSLLLNTNVTGFLTVSNRLTANGEFVQRIDRKTLTGFTSANSLNVVGLSTFGGIATFQDDVFIQGDVETSGGLTFRDLNVTGIATVGSRLDVTGPSTFTSVITSGITTLGTSTGFGTVTVGTGGSALLVDGDMRVHGDFFAGRNTVQIISSQDTIKVGSAITIGGKAGTANEGFIYAQRVSVANTITAGEFIGDGSQLTGVVGVATVANVFFVNESGNDTNSGESPYEAKRTVGAALTLATEGSTIRVAAGNYSENNPLVMPEQVSIDGDSLREVSLSPQNADQDFIYVANGNYVGDVSFTGTLNEGKAVIAFNPNKPSYVTTGPYIRNCTNFISNSIGMKIDGAHVIGDTRAMNVDSYTQYNQGGIGVSISNDGYAQLVSIFTICNDQSIVCTTGGQCDLTNSNSSFGRLGLVADGIGPQNFIGTVRDAASADADTFTLNVGYSTIAVNLANYDNISGIVTISTVDNHGYNIGMGVTVNDLIFSCGGSGTDVFPSGNFGNIFYVRSIPSSNSFSAFVGVSTLQHTWSAGGYVAPYVARPYDGQLVYFDDLYYTINGIEITNPGDGYGNVPPSITIDAPTEPWGIRATAVAELTNGSVTGIQMVSNGRGYTSVPNVTISAPQSGTQAVGVAQSLPTYYVVNSATPVVNGITTVTLADNVPYAVGVGSTVPFFRQSKILSSSHAFEYIGSGNTIASALPQRGGASIPENETNSLNGGLVVYTSTNEKGDFKIGDGVIINQQTGSISGDAYTRSLFANITPYILALGGGE